MSNVTTIKSLIGFAILGWLTLLAPVNVAAKNSASPDSDPAQHLNTLHPGIPPTSKQLADRLAILNVLGIYAGYINDADLKGWSDLFADDAIFEIEFPNGIHLIDKETLVAGEKHIFAIYQERLADHKLGERRIYFFSNPHIKSQQSDSAKVGVSLQIIRILPDGSTPYIELSATYSGTMIKRDNRWLLHRYRP